MAPESSATTLRKLAFSTPAGFLASGFGSGLSPLAPGTVGTVVALPLGVLLRQLPLAACALLVVLSFVLGVFVCDRTSRRMGAEDPGGIVWDEFVGLWLAVLLIPMHWPWWLAAFVLFRLFDILKPWPVGLVDRSVHGGFGIMVDDVIAGAYALLILSAAQYVLL